MQPLQYAVRRLMWYVIFDFRDVTKYRLAIAFPDYPHHTDICSLGPVKTLVLETRTQVHCICIRV